MNETDYNEWRPAPPATQPRCQRRCRRHLRCRLPLAVRRLSCGLAKTKFVFAFVLLKNCCFSLSLACFAILFNAILLIVLFFYASIEQIAFFLSSFFALLVFLCIFLFFVFFVFFWCSTDSSSPVTEARRDSEHIKTRSCVDSAKHFLGIMKLRHFW